MCHMHIYIYIIFIYRHVHIDWKTSDSPVEMWRPRVLSSKVTIFAPAIDQNGLMTSEADEKSHHGNLKRLETDQAVDVQVIRGAKKWCSLALQ